MKTFFYRNLKTQKGAAALEFAIVLPLLLLLLFGTIELSICLYDKAMITNASREGARAGIVYSHPNPVSDPEIMNVVNTYCATHLISFAPGSSPTTVIARTIEPYGDALRVRVTYVYNFLVLPNFMGALVGGSTLTAETLMRMEG
jgi:Flp pilus assembly protein TadG